MTTVGVVAIGRNEGERLRRCLRSVAAPGRRLVYVDSGSTDDSVAFARTMGVEVVDLDMSRPFTMARGRNAGFARLMEKWPDTELVQFVDGDCELRAGWIERGVEELARRTDAAAVAGRRRERHPEASIYNRMADFEWETPAGDAIALGGEMLIRAGALREAGLYNEAMIAGEEPELCYRLRRAGWRVVRLPVEMSIHDAAMSRFGQWWRRAVRGGHAYAEASWLHGREAERYRVRETASMALWALGPPALAIVGVIALGAWGLLALLVYPAQWTRMALRFRRQGRTWREARLCAAFGLASKFAGLQGALRFWWGRATSRRAALIEYKGPSVEKRATSRASGDGAGRAPDGRIHYMSPAALGDAWVGNELKQVAAAGIPFTLHCLRLPGKTPYFTSEWARKVQADAKPVLPASAPALAWSALAAPFLFRRRFFGAVWNCIVGRRESMRARATCLWQTLLACHWARGLRHNPPAHIHSQWIHSAGTVAWQGARLLGVPFSFTGHAADLFRNAVALRDKVRDAAFIGCISEFHRRLFLDLGARPEQLVIVYCGIDVAHFTPRRRRRAPGERPRILSAGRLVEKKGFDVLIDACALLKGRGREVECVIRGSGPLEGALRAHIARAGLEGVVTLDARAIAQEEIPEFMAGGDAFALACVWAKDDDVDGLPQMLMEAMACGLPAVSTRLVGIPDLIEHDATGLQVEAGSAPALADALERLVADDAVAERLARAGRRIVEEKFDIETCLEPLLSRYRARLGLARGVGAAGRAPAREAVTA